MSTGRQFSPLFDNYIIRIETDSARTGSGGTKPGRIALLLSYRNIRIFPLERKDSLAGLGQKPTDPRKQGKNFSQNNKLGTRPHIPGGHAWASLKHGFPLPREGLFFGPYPRRTRLGLIEAST